MDATEEIAFTQGVFPIETLRSVAFLPHYATGM